MCFEITTTDGMKIKVITKNKNKTTIEIRQENTTHKFSIDLDDHLNVIGDTYLKTEYNNIFSFLINKLKNIFKI